eukprot:gnl/TRDRNA2_/TRDRNA2_33269_c0_seq1.p1 gnl/TRDRNA2_/TRDRNA2_33269_c0~~gnl/TRDRNA2_/TRDRNA2_33269_c0_seq1.p1  ORF type:complete len:313 (+),score=60.43 gnl/TRDRNA2_/TRDRNA2_33269_c0_seq1:63-1001(+)
MLPQSDKITGIDASGLHEWMSRLPVSVRTTRSITELALPAAHNAGARAVKAVPFHVLAKFVGAAGAQNPLVATFAQPMAAAAACCQSATIDELLRHGLRALDLRVDLVDGEPQICHTVVCDVTLEHALGQLASFLAEPAHTDEVVVVTIRRDFEAQAMRTADDWALVQAVVAGVLEEVGIAGPEGLSASLQQLTDVGTRVVVLLECPEDVDVFLGVRLTPGTHEKSWRDETRSVEQMLAVLEEWATAGRLQPQRGKLKFLETALPGTPAALASAALAGFRNWVAVKPLSIGVMMDFPDDETVLTVVRKNGFS